MRHVTEAHSNMQGAQKVGAEGSDDREWAGGQERREKSQKLDCSRAVA